MARDKFELSDMNDSQTDLTPAARRGRGCFVSLPIAFVLVLLAAVVAVGVGIIVHFAGGDRDVVCHCMGSDTVPERPSADQIKQECIAQAGAGDQEICKACQGASTPVSPTSVTGSATAAGTTTSASGSNTGAPTTSTPPKVTDVRLPTAVYPQHYDVELFPDMSDLNPDNFTFRGSVKIVVRCDNATDNITLHVNVLTVNTSTIRFYPETPSATGDPKFVSSEVDKDRQFFILKLDKDMQ
ncbi:unnamed protein product, partial [Candidula unifasciata]